MSFAMPVSWGLKRSLSETKRYGKIKERKDMPDRKFPDHGGATAQMDVQTL
jgi:hypothetical protein